MADLLPKSHRILEKRFMECPPFGKDSNGKNIRDVSGITINANLEHLQNVVSTKKGQDAAKHAVEELVRLLNERIPDPAFHVTREFLANPWNSYSYEFAMFLSELCVDLTEDPHFPVTLGREKFLSPLIQVLGRPFSIVQIFKMYPYFVEKYTKGALLPEVVSVTRGKAIMRLKLSEHTARQFGRYRLGCSHRICQTTKATIAETPARMFGLRPATIKDCCCMGDGAEYCEWIFTWEPRASQSLHWPAVGLLAGGVLLLYLRTQHPAVSLLESLGLSIIPVFTLWAAGTLWTDKQALQGQGKIIQEQLQLVETRHEELRDAYLDQEQTAVELGRRVAELTMLYQIGIRLSSTLDRNSVITAALEAIMRDLHYDRVMLSFFDSTWRIAHKARVVGVSPELAAMAHSLEVPITDPESPEGTVLLRGVPILVNEVDEIRSRLHPLNQQLVAAINTRGFIAVPLQAKDHVLGALLADRTHSRPLTQNDVNLLMTVSAQMTLALENSEAYQQIEQLNLGLEAKVRERTYELEQANRHLETTNEQLEETNRVKSQFLSHCSHELRTPLTSIKGFTENLLQGLCGPLTQKQQTVLHRVTTNADRLTRMIADLLDLTRIEAGKIHLNWAWINLRHLADEVLGQVAPLAQGKGQQLEVVCSEEDLCLWGDGDRLTQVLMNLVHNSIKFTPEGGRIQIHLHPASADSIVMAVTDTGPGIPEAAIPQLFDPFFQAHGQKEFGTKGLGLGLAIVKNLVDLHYGTLRVESRVGQGTTFRVILPANTDQTPESSHPPP